MFLFLGAEEISVNKINLPVDLPKFQELSPVCDLSLCRVITFLHDLIGTEPSPVLTTEEL